MLMLAVPTVIPLSVCVVAEVQTPTCCVGAAVPTALPIQLAVLTEVLPDAIYPAPTLPDAARKALLFCRIRSV